MAIRYDKKINNLIRRIVNNYNAKIKRLEGRQDERSLYLLGLIDKLLKICVKQLKIVLI